MNPLTFVHHTHYSSVCCPWNTTLERRALVTPVMCRSCEDHVTYSKVKHDLQFVGHKRELLLGAVGHLHLLEVGLALVEHVRGVHHWQRQHTSQERVFIHILQGERGMRAQWLLSGGPTPHLPQVCQVPLAEVHSNGIESNVLQVLLVVLPSTHSLAPKRRGPRDLRTNAGPETVTSIDKTLLTSAAHTSLPPSLPLPHLPFLCSGSLIQSSQYFSGHLGLSSCHRSLVIIQPSPGKKSVL